MYIIEHVKINSFLFQIQGYFQTKKGKLCSEKGDFAVDDIKACEDAANYFGYDFKRTADLPNWPKGCSIFDGVYGDVYFNLNPTDSSNVEARQICEIRDEE